MCARAALLQNVHACVVDSWTKKSIISKGLLYYIYLRITVQTIHNNRVDVGQSAYTLPPCVEPCVKPCVKPGAIHRQSVSFQKYGKKLCNLIMTTEIIPPLSCVLACSVMCPVLDAQCFALYLFLLL